MFVGLMERPIKFKGLIPMMERCAIAASYYITGKI